MPENTEETQPIKNWILVALDDNFINGTIVAGNDTFVMDEETAKSKEETLNQTSVHLRWVALEIPLPSE